MMLKESPDAEPTWADIGRDLEYAIQIWLTEQKAIDRGIYPKDKITERSSE